MGREITVVAQDRGRLGTALWLERTGGHMSTSERWSLVPAMARALFEGLSLRRAARKSGRRDAELALFEPPATPIVEAARAHLLANALPPMANHAQRTAFWTLAVMNQHMELAPRDIETAWVAALLHDVGLEQPPARGDFSRGGIDVLERLALEHRWPEEQTHAAREAIATNLSAQVDRERSGTVAWAMNVGGLGELGFGPHRAQWHPERVAELEKRFPRTDFRVTARRLIAEEAARVPDGRFSFFRYVFPFLMKG